MSNYVEPYYAAFNCVQHGCIHLSCRLCTLVKRGLSCDELIAQYCTYLRKFSMVVYKCNVLNYFNVYKYDCYHSRSWTYGNTVHTKIYCDESIQRGCSNVYSQNVMGATQPLQAVVSQVVYQLFKHPMLLPVAPTLNLRFQHQLRHSITMIGNSMS